VALYKASNNRLVCAALAIDNYLYPKGFVVWDDKRVECTLERAVAKVKTKYWLLIVGFHISKSIPELNSIQMSSK